MRSLLVRLATLGTVVALVVGCDQRSITTAVPGGNGGGTGTGGGSGSTGAKPLVSIDTPAAGALVNLGDSILVAVRVRDAAGLASLTIAGYSYRGDASLGTATVTKRYDATPVPAPGAPAIRTGPIDTLVRRYLRPVAPVDTTQDSVVVLAIATNSAGAVDTARRTVRVITGPRVRVISPVAGDSVQAGISLALQVRATHTEGVSRMSVRVQGEASWPTPLDTTITQTYNSAKEANLDASVFIPSNAPPRGRITITPTATDVNRIPGSAVPVVVYVRATPAPAPRVTQEVPTRAEIRDTIVITAAGDGIMSVGFIVRDSAGALIRRDSIVYAAPYLSPRRVSLSLGLGAEVQGRRVSVTSFAIDRSSRYGYSVPAGSSVSVTQESLAQSDSVLLVHGLTYKLLRPGIAGDVAVDAARGRVFVSNTDFNLLEVWRRDSLKFTPNGVAVGSLPWGLAMSPAEDELLVANSGGTNISKVSITGDPAGMSESSRILTRNSVIFEITEVRDPNITSKIRLQVTGPFSYSDRPQYVAQSAGGRIYYSTRPTKNATAGTLRWLDPTEAYPESRQIYQYASRVQDAVNKYVIFGADAVFRCPAAAESVEPDSLIIFDHPSGTKDPSTGETKCNATSVAQAVANLHTIVPSSDVVAVQGLSVPSLALTDTTFLAVSGDKTWLGFGEGHTGVAAARVVMVNDNAPAGPVDPNNLFFSPGIDVADIMDNASEPVFGLGIDKHGKTLAVHGAQSYFASVEYPFHLRLQGKYSSFSAGAGIAFHPDADVSPEAPDGPNSLKNLAFVASANGTIEIVDAFFYRRRGRINTKTNLYGPIRASGRMPGDPPEVLMKLYGLSKDGLVVIDVTARDIQ